MTAEIGDCPELWNYVDHIIMLLTDSPSIRDVILFPLMKPEGA